MENKNYTTEIIKDQNTKNDLFAKVEVVGDLEVGKTSILKKITQNEFLEEYTPTLGYEFNPYLIKVNDTILKLQIWDMCGNENYRSVLLNLYRNASLGILVYSVTSKESFNNLENWITQLKKYALPGSKIILIGNKSDDEEHRVVSYEEGKEICEKNNLEFFMEVSAKNGFESPNFLELAAISLYKDYELHKDDNDMSLSLMNRGESIMLDRKQMNKDHNKNCC
jgi:small GTP-binding protein